MNLFFIFSFFLIINLVAAYVWTGTNLDIKYRYLRVVSYAVVAASTGTFIATRGSDASTLFYYLLNFIGGIILFEWDFIASAKFIFVISIIEFLFVMVYGAVYFL